MSWLCVDVQESLLVVLSCSLWTVPLMNYVVILREILENDFWDELSVIKFPPFQSMSLPATQLSCSLCRNLLLLALE